MENINLDVYNKQTGPGRPRLARKKLRINVLIDPEDYEILQESGVENFSEWVRDKIKIEIENKEVKIWEKAARDLYLEFFKPLDYAYNDYISIGNVKISVESVCKHAYQPAIFHSTEVKKEVRTWFNSITDDQLQKDLIRVLELIDARYGI